MGKKILVVDDELGYREFYKYLLEPLGYHVETAEDGEQGCEMAVKKSYDLILLDVHLPKMIGTEVLKRIKQVRPSQKVVIFSSSSDTTYQFEKEAKELGAFECLYKPVDLEDILDVIKRAIGDSAVRGAVND